MKFTFTLPTVIVIQNFCIVCGNPGATIGNIKHALHGGGQGYHPECGSTRKPCKRCGEKFKVEDLNIAYWDYPNWYCDTCNEAITPGSETFKKEHPGWEERQAMFNKKEQKP